MKVVVEETYVTSKEIEVSVKLMERLDGTRGIEALIEAEKELMVMAGRAEQTGTEWLRTTFHNDGGDLITEVEGGNES